MTEKEKMQYAKNYIDQLANGINPLNGEPIRDDDIVNNIHISRCLFYVSFVLQNSIENDKNSSKNKLPFNISAEQLSKFQFSDDGITISEIVKRINNLVDLETFKKLQYTVISDWLVDIGMLEVITKSDGKHSKRPTKQGEDLGIKTEQKTGYNGPYVAVTYNREAQQFIIDNLLDLVL